MVSQELQRKIDQSIRLLRTICGEDVVEVAYSGGKDSYVILQLAKESGINYRAIYKNTTIDPPGTLKHVKDMGVEVMMPKNGITFFKLIEKRSFPSRIKRVCCEHLKEYKIMDKVIIGVRKEESKARNDRYKEPTLCRYFNKTDYVEEVLPILDWTTKDVAEYLLDRNIKAAPVYYDENGEFHPERRLGCMCCPIISKKKRIEEFKNHPGMVKGYCKAEKVFMETHPDCVISKEHKNEFEAFYRNLFYPTNAEWKNAKHSLFDEPDYKAELERIFNIKL